MEKWVKFPILNKIFREGFYFSNGSLFSGRIRRRYRLLDYFSKEDIEKGETAWHDYKQYIFQGNYYVEDNKVFLKSYIKIHFSNNNIEGKEFENMDLLNEYVDNIKKLNKNIIVL